MLVGNLIMLCRSFSAFLSICLFLLYSLSDLSLTGSAFFGIAAYNCTHYTHSDSCGQLVFICTDLCWVTMKLVNACSFISIDVRLYVRCSVWLMKQHVCPFGICQVHGVRWASEYRRAVTILGGCFRSPRWLALLNWVSWDLCNAEITYIQPGSCALYRHLLLSPNVR